MRKLFSLSLAYFFVWCAVFFLLSYFGLKGDYLASGTAAVVGYFAYLVYELEQVNRLKSAAKTVILDVRNAEEALTAVQGGGSYATWSKVSIIENNWPKLKQYFITLLTTDEFKAFEHFFHYWSELVAAKKRHERTRDAAIVSKAEYVQQKLLDLYAELPPDLEEKRIKIISRANSETFLFDSDLSQQQITHFLSAIRPLSGTTGFEKLRRIAGMR